MFADNPHLTELKTIHNFLSRSLNAAASQDFTAIDAPFRSIFFEITAIGIGVLDRDGFVIESNLALQRMLGYSAEEFCHMRYTDYTHPDDVELDAQFMQQVLSGQRNHFYLEKRYLCKNGQVFWGRLTVSAVRNAQGQVWFTFGTVEDITEQRQAEDALQDQKAFLRLVLDSIPQAIYWKDQHLIYQGGNQRWAEQFGFDRPEALIGKTEAELWSSVSAPAEAIEQEQQEQHLIQVEVPTLHQICTRTLPDRRTVWWDHYQIPIHDTSGAIVGLLGVVTDITEQRQAEEALRYTEAMYRSIFENAVEGIFQATLTGRYLNANPMLAHIYGYDTPDELITTLTNVQQQLYVQPSRWTELVQLLQEQGAVWGYESQVYRRDGQVIWISESLRALYDDREELTGYEGTVEDITHRKQAEAELHKRDALLQGMAEAANRLLLNPDWNLVVPEVLEILGTASQADRVSLYEHHPHPVSGDLSLTKRLEWLADSIAASAQHWQHRSYQVDGLGRWYEALSQGEAVSGCTRQFPPSEQRLLGQDQVLSTLIVPVFVNNQLWGAIGFDDCRVERPWSASEQSILVAVAASLGAAMRRQHTEEQMRYQAFHDGLTNLPNRVLFNYRVTLAIEQAQQTSEPLAVMFLDLDRFKTINDTLGHAVGDRLLQDATIRLTHCLRDEDLIARWGGDEFTLLLPHLKTSEDAAKVAQRIADALRPTFQLEHHELHVTGSIGIALYPQDGEDAQTLIRNADAALYRVKAQGRNGYQFYDATGYSSARERLALDSYLFQALERQEFILHYQPQINVLTQQVTQMEALLRWQHPTLGLVPPATFIALAEENGMIVPIGEWALRSACWQAKQWQTAGWPVRVAVNLSARQFQSPNLVERVAQVLQETDLLPGFLELEITETAAMQDVELTKTTLHELRHMGVRIAVDDFGTGYSSLMYLKKFPLHGLKIDRSFVQELTDHADDAAIVSTIITLAQGLKLSVIAEGVETVAQVEQLRSMGCAEMQGYWFSPALPVAAATEFLQQFGR